MSSTKESDQRRCQLDTLRSTSGSSGRSAVSNTTSPVASQQNLPRTDSTIPDAILSVVGRTDGHDTGSEADEKDYRNNGGIGSGGDDDDDDDDYDDDDANDNDDDDDDEDLVFEEADKQRVKLTSTRVGGIHVRGTAVDVDFDDDIERTISSSSASLRDEEPSSSQNRAAMVREVCNHATVLERRRKAEERRKQRMVLHYRKLMTQTFDATVGEGGAFGEALQRHASDVSMATEESGARSSRVQEGNQRTVGGRLALPFQMMAAALQKGKAAPSADARTDANASARLRSGSSLRRRRGGGGMEEGKGEGGGARSARFEQGGGGRGKKEEKEEEEEEEEEERKKKERRKRRKKKNKRKKRRKRKHAHKHGMWHGVIVPILETMWGILLFLRFNVIVGEAGIWQSWLMALLGYLCSLSTTLSISALVTNTHVRRGGVYSYISRSLGKALGGAVGLMYAVGLVFDAALEAVGSVTVFKQVTMAYIPEWDQDERVYAIVVNILIASLCIFFLERISAVSVVFVVFVAFALISLFISISASGWVVASGYSWLAPGGGIDLAANISNLGLSNQNFQNNWAPRFSRAGEGGSESQDFTTMFALFFPMFTGILSGANRAETLANPHRDIPRGTFIAISFSFVLYIALFTLYGSMSDRDYLSGALCTCNATCAGLDTWCPQDSLQCLQNFQVPQCEARECSPATTGRFGSESGVACPTGVANQTNVDCRISYFEEYFLQELPNNYFLGSCPITNAIGIPSAQLLNWCIFM